MPSGISTVFLQLTAAGTDHTAVNLLLDRTMISLKKSSKNCAVCKAPATCQNFGAVTCEACKSFFRRAFIKDVYRSYRCRNDGNCTIDAQDRKSCTYCRFQRCVSAGMEIGKSRKTEGNSSLQLTQSKTNTETREKEIEVAAQELLQELLSLTSCFVPTINDKGKFFTMMEIFDLDSLGSKYSHSFYNIPVAKEMVVATTEMSLEKSVGVIAAILQRLIFFSNSITEFGQLDFNDRKILFRGACSELCMINTVLAFDKELGIWLAPVNSSSSFYQNLPGVTCQLLAEVLGQDLHEEKIDVTVAVQKYHPDETVVMLLFAILLFTPNRKSLVNVEAVQKCQIHFALLLRKYLRWRFGEKEGEEVFLLVTKSLKGFRRLAPPVFQKIHGPLLDSSNSSFGNIRNCLPA